MNTHSSWKVRTSLFAAVLAVACMSPAGHAQTVKARVNVPFAFEYGSRHFDAGRYILNANGPIMSIQGRSRFALAITQQDINMQPASRSKVVFHRYGSRYYLREVWTVGERTHLHCAPSKEEKQAQKMLVATNQTAPAGIEAALLETPR